jgi:mannose-6-phosphate isomerase-like protein (cupin superfamily)
LTPRSGVSTPECLLRLPHIHERYDEGFFIIDGEIEYTVGAGDDRQTIAAKAGGSVWIPRGTAHACTVKSEVTRAELLHPRRL